MCAQAPGAPTLPLAGLLPSRVLKFALVLSTCSQHCSLLSLSSKKLSCNFVLDIAPLQLLGPRLLFQILVISLSSRLSSTLPAFTKQVSDDVI